MWNRKWFVRQWPLLLVRSGLVLFAVTCVASARLPAEAIFAGPAMMLAGAAMQEYYKRESLGQDDGGPR